MTYSMGMQIPYGICAQISKKNNIRSDQKSDVGKILRELCERKGIDMIEAECCPDHVHMLVRIPPKYSVAEIMGYLIGKSALMIFDRHADLKYNMGIGVFGVAAILWIL